MRNSHLTDAYLCLEIWFLLRADFFEKNNIKSMMKTSRIKIANKGLFITET